MPYSFRSKSFQPVRGYPNSLHMVFSFAVAESCAACCVFQTTVDCFRRSAVKSFLPLFLEIPDADVEPPAYADTLHAQVASWFIGMVMGVQIGFVATHHHYRDCKEAGGSFDACYSIVGEWVDE